MKVVNVEVWKRPAGRTERTYLVPVCEDVYQQRIVIDQGTLRFYDTVATELSDQGYRLT